MAQLVKRPTLDFGPDHDLTVHEFEPQIGLCADRAEPAWNSLFLSLSPPPPLVLACFLKKKEKVYHWQQILPVVFLEVKSSLCTYCLLFIYFLMFLNLFLSETESTSGEGQREREGDAESEEGSRL